MVRINKGQAKSKQITKCDVCGTEKKGSHNTMICNFCDKEMFFSSKHCGCYGTCCKPRKCCNEGREYDIKCYNIK